MNGMAMGKVSGVPMAEDAPPDLLAGGMDLRVVLPCGSVARCNVDRGTPMMDLLVQLAKVHRISPAAHTLQPFGIKNTPLQSQPSTPIGALDVFTVKIVPKARPLAPLGKRTAPRPTPAQPFEQTFRLQVHLPRNQLFVTRASRATVLGDIRHLACTEKNLDPLKYELRHPANLDQRLDPDATLGECGLTEVALVAAGGRLGLSQPLPDIMDLRRQEERRREAAKAGQFGYLTSHSMAEGSVSSASSGSLGGRSTSPAPSDGERSTSPPAIQPLQQLQAPSRPGRKRRPAPKPPVGAQPAAANAAATTTEMNNNINKEVIASGGTVISHSRNSSDSSGYHEASVLSESPEGQHDGGLQGLRQHQGRGTATAKLQSCVSQPNLNLSRSMTNLSVQQQLCVRGNRNSIAVSGHLAHDVQDGLGRVPGAHRASTSSLATAGQRKKKAPPPPPPGAPAVPQPRPAGDGSAAPAPSPAAPADPFLKTQSLERQTSSATEDAAPPLRPGLTKSCTLPSSLSSAASPSSAAGTDTGAFPPVGSASSVSATGSSSSCPTPTPSEQSVHLSENTPPKVAPRPAQRIPALAPSPAPRPRPRKPIAPTPPASPTRPAPLTPPAEHGVAAPQSAGTGIWTQAPSVDDTDKMPEASSSVLDDHLEAVDQSGGGVQPSDGFKVDEATPTERGVALDKEQQTAFVNGEDADSDLGTAEDSSPPRSDFHDDESSSERNIQINDDKLDKESDRDSPVEKCQTPIVTELITKLGDINHSESLDKQNLKQVESSPSPNPQGTVEEEWEYRLPSPPSAFRDSRSHSPTVTEFDSVNLAETNLSSSASLGKCEEKEEKSSEREGPTDISRKDELECENVKPQPSNENAPALDSSFDVKTCHKQEEVSAPRETATSTTAIETVINTTQTVIHSMNVPNESEKKLEGSAAVLDELNKVLSEQRSNILSTHVPGHVELTQETGHQPAPIENFSMAVYSRPTSAEGMPAPEVRPSLVLARRSSFSNSNGSLNTLSRPIGTGVRRTTSHATLVGGRREVNGFNYNSPSVDNVMASEEIRKTAPASNRQEVQSLGRAVSEMNLCSEPELFKEFMEWKQQRLKEQEEKEKQQKASPTQDLQSPQMLRNIMTQSQDDINANVESRKEKENISTSKNTSENAKKRGVEKKPVEEIPKPIEQEQLKRFVPRGPPSVQLSTWSERPVRQVSIKMDRDYWIGVGGAALRPTSQRSRDVVDSTESKTQAKSQKTSSSVEDQKKSFPPSETVQRLSRQYIVHTTPSGFRRSAEPVDNGGVTASSLGKSQTNQTSHTVSEAVKTPKLVSSVSTGALPDRFERVKEGLHHLASLPETKSVEVSVTSKSDPSRVPIVRAVELKKTVSSDFRKPLIRQNATATSPNSSVVYFSSGPVATSSITANGNSVNISSAKPSPPVKKFTSVVDISGPSSEKTTSGPSETQPPPIKPSVQVNGFASNSEPKKNLPMPVVKGFKLAQAGTVRQLSAPAATPAPPAPTPVSVPTPSVTSIPAPVPPPAPVMPVLKRVPRPSSLPARVQDPRDQLLEAIRNFGGRTKLRPTT